MINANLKTDSGTHSKAEQSSTAPHAPICASAAGQILTRYHPPYLNTTMDFYKSGSLFGPNESKCAGKRRGKRRKSNPLTVGAVDTSVSHFV